MKLGIISDAHHYYDGQGRLCTLTPLARQFEQWAKLFDQVIVCAPLLSGLLPTTHCPYRANNIELIPIEKAGGDTLQAKIEMLLKHRGWWRALNALLSKVDAVHIRVPNNISVLGQLLLLRSKCYRQAVYTGNWAGYKNEPLSYRVQRWFLENHFRGPIAVYGQWSGQPLHVVSTFSPSYDDEIWLQEQNTVSQKIQRLQSSDRLAEPIKLLTIGTLDRNKNQQLVIQAIKVLQEQNMKAELHIVGDGPKRHELSQLASELGLAGQVHFTGKVSPERVRQFFRETDFVVQASFTEGFTKVPVEGLFHGAIPLLTALPVNRQIAGGGERGRTFPAGDARLLASHVAELSRCPAELILLIKNGREYARTVTLDAWRQHIKLMLEQNWRVQL